MKVDIRPGVSLIKPGEPFTYVHPHATVAINPWALQGIETGKIVTFSGASGAGKTTITEALHAPGQYEAVGKMATRMPRGGSLYERFVTPQKIENMKDRRDFLYWMLYGGAEYLLPATPIVDLLASNLTVLVDTPTIAALPLKKHLPDKVTTVFVDVPYPEVTLANRMMSRGDPQDKIKERLADISHVYERRKEFDVVIFNGDASLDEAPPVLQVVTNVLESV